MKYWARATKISDTRCLAGPLRAHSENCPWRIGFRLSATFAGRAWPSCCVTSPGKRSSFSCSRTRDGDQQPVYPQVGCRLRKTRSTAKQEGEKDKNLVSKKSRAAAPRPMARRRNGGVLVGFDSRTHPVFTRQHRIAIFSRFIWHILLQDIRVGKESQDRLLNISVMELRSVAVVRIQSSGL